ncbi:MAG: hypothetical protein AB9866_03110 [Syntrophobacteraceae bacterium]
MQHVMGSAFAPRKANAAGMDTLLAGAKYLKNSGAHGRMKERVKRVISASTGRGEDGQ